MKLFITFYKLKYNNIHILILFIIFITPIKNIFFIYFMSE